MPAIKQLMDEVLSGPIVGRRTEGPLAEEQKLVASAKKLGLFAAGAATQKYMQAIQISRRSWARSPTWSSRFTRWNRRCCAHKDRRAQGESAAALPIAMARVYLSQAMEKIEGLARKIIGAVAEGDMLRTQLAILAVWRKHDHTTPSKCAGRLRRNNSNEGATR